MNYHKANITKLWVNGRENRRRLKQHARRDVRENLLILSSCKQLKKRFFFGNAYLDFLVLAVRHDRVFGGDASQNAKELSLISNFILSHHQLVLKVKREEF